MALSCVGSLMFYNTADDESISAMGTQVWLSLVYPDAFFFFFFHETIRQWNRIAEFVLSEDLASLGNLAASDPGFQKWGQTAGTGGEKGTCTRSPARAVAPTSFPFTAGMGRTMKHPQRPRCARSSRCRFERQDRGFLLKPRSSRCFFLRPRTRTCSTLL